MATERPILQGADLIKYLDRGEVAQSQRMIAEELNFVEVCRDPQGDEHPGTADILLGRLAETDTHYFAETTVLSDVHQGNSELGPALGFGVAFLEGDGNSSLYIAHVHGASQQDKIEASIFRLKEHPVVVDQGAANVFNQDKEILWQGGAEVVDVSQDGKNVVFAFPKLEVIVGKKMRYFTTEGDTKQAAQLHNKDVCEEAVTTETPTPVVPSPTATPKQPTPTATATAEQTPAVLPPSGGKGAGSDTNELLTGALVSTAALTAAAAFGASRLVKNLSKKLR